MNNRRQEIYDKIRESSKEEYILSEMIRLGFWPEGQDVPGDPADFIRQKGALQREISELQKELNHLGDMDSLIREARRKRMVEAKAKRLETKKRREEERKEKARVWQEKQANDIVYLGEGVSGGLNEKESDLNLLKNFNLPVMHTVNDLSDLMKLSVSQIRQLSYHQDVSTSSNYIRFSIPKKTGGVRHISAPKPMLKFAQEWLLQNILYKVENHNAAHGFCPSRSIKSNAEVHLGAELLINIDLENFFPTITYKRTKGLFKSLGYSESLATVFALISSEPDCEEVFLDNQTYHVSQGERKLPQGSPASPAITNLICRKMDTRLDGLGKKFGFVYSRYADDMSFSTKAPDNQALGRFLRHITQIIAEEGFNIHPRKTKITRKGRRHEVTGVVVNEKLSIPRKKLKAFRAVLFQVEKDGPEGKHWGNSKDVIAALKGYAHFVYMIDPEKGQAFNEQVKQIIKKYNWQAHAYRLPSDKVSDFSKKEFKRSALDAEAEKQLDQELDSNSNKPWWKFW